MYADLLTRVADDVLAGGPAATCLAGHEDDSGPSALGLRLMGSVHRLVLLRQAGALATSYPTVGGTFEPDATWSAFRALLADEPERVREWLDRAPQTNEVGRSAALLGGLHHLVDEFDLPVGLHEIGSSGGLNLRCDHYACVDEDGEVQGAPDSPVRLAWRGRRLRGPAPRITERLGSDLFPIEVATTDGRLALTAYTWPDQTERFERLRGAFEVAGRVPAEVRQQDAASFAEELELVEGRWTVLAHSVLWQYLDRADQGRISAHLDRLGETATATARLAHLRAEPVRSAPGAPHVLLVVLTMWPGGERQVLGEMPAHGTPTTWT